MKFKVYNNVNDFYKATFDVLMRDEAQNMIMLGNLIIGHEGKDKRDWRDPAHWLMVTVSDETGILLTGLMTPPHNITLYATDNKIHSDALSCLCHGLLAYDLPGVTTEKHLAESFADMYTDQKGQTYKTTMSQRIYELKSVNQNIQQIGDVRLIENRDMNYFPYWLEAFHSAGTYGKTDMKIPQDAQDYQYRIDSKKLYVLEEKGLPVSMAGFTRVMQRAIGVAFVYTPPYFRGKGYASSCVAQLSQLALDKGYDRCVLYTDLLNPTSNSIYKKIGYKPICDSLMLTFESSTCGG